MTAERVLCVGLPERERSWLKPWLTARGVQTWFADAAVLALQTAADVEPTTVIIDTLLESFDPVRLGAYIQASLPGCEVAFVGNQNIEAAFFATQTEVSNARFCHRPIDPEDLVPSAVERREAERSSTLLVGTHGLASLLFGLVESAETGLLYVGEGERRRIVHVREGAPTYVESRIVSENFGALLIEWGVASKVEVDWARSMQLSAGVRQGEALVKIGVLSEEDVEPLLQRQQEHKLFCAMKDAPCKVRFEEASGQVSQGAFGRPGLFDAAARAFEFGAEVSGSEAVGWTDGSAERVKTMATIPDAVRDAIDANGTVSGLASATKSPAGAVNLLQCLGLVTTSAGEAHRKAG
ncbi:MAG: hypothetical protein ACI81R_001072 [Bradymonadia bacterium]|jgi:hypothetical protein